MSSAPTIADVTVTLDDSVARELLSLGGVVEGDVPSWRLPDGTQTTDPQAALAGALRAIANGEGAAVREAEEITRSRQHHYHDPAGPASAQPSRARRYGAQRPRARLAHPRRPRKPDPRVAVTDALVAIAEDDLAAQFIETGRD